MSRRIVVVDDHVPFLEAARVALSAAGWEVHSVADSGAVMAAVGEHAPDVVLLDVQLPEPIGFDIAELVLAEKQAPVVVLISARSASDYGDAVAASGAQGFIDKADFSASALADVLAGGR